MSKTPTKTFSRRSILGTIGAAATGIAVSSNQATADSGDYETINVVDAGADNTGGESITHVLEEVIGDNRKLYFPPGEYYIDEGIRFTDFDKLWIEGDDATIIPAPVDEFNGPDYIFKIGTHYAPGDWFRMGDFTFDFTGANTGTRAIQAQVNDCWIHDIDFVGEHDSGSHGPMLVDVIDPTSTAAVDRVSMPDGGAWTEDTEQNGDTVVRWGPTGFIVSPYNEGTLWIRDCEIGGFPDNGLYDSGESGEVVVRGGTFKNSNTANIRLDGDRGVVDGATVIVDGARENDTDQQGIRLDSGSDVLVQNTEVRLKEPTSNAITLRGTDSARITDSQITVSRGHVDGAIMVREGAGETTIDNVDIELDSTGQAIEIEPGDGEVLVEECTITGDASGDSGGRHAIRCERDGTQLYSNTVEQPGEGYRRALTLVADDCVVSKGRYESTHHAIVNNGAGNIITKIDAQAYNGSEGIKAVENVELYWSTIHGGVSGPYDGYGNEV